MFFIQLPGEDHRGDGQHRGAGGGDDPRAGDHDGAAGVQQLQRRPRHHLRPQQLRSIQARSHQRGRKGPDFTSKELHLRVETYICHLYVFVAESPEAPDERLRGGVVLRRGSL